MFILFNGQYIVYIQNQVFYYYLVLYIFSTITNLLMSLKLPRRTIVTAHILLTLYSPYIEITNICYILSAISLLATKLTDFPKSLKNVFFFNYYR